VKKIAVLTFILFYTGCATIHSPIPENYTGPISIISSTDKRHHSSKADMFYLQGIDGKVIKNAIGETRRASYGQGGKLTTVHPDIEVPSKEATFTIVGRTEYAMPIQALTNAVYEVKGDIVFSPISNEKYIVKGALGKEYSSVWLEVKGTGEVIKNKIEIQGNSSLGFFDK